MRTLSFWDIIKRSIIYDGYPCYDCSKIQRQKITFSSFFTDPLFVIAMHQFDIILVCTAIILTILVISCIVFVSIQESHTKTRHKTMNMSSPSKILSDKKFIQTCSNVLLTGEWETLYPDKTVHWNTTKHSSFSGNAYMSWRGPQSCGLKVYKWQEMQECLRDNYPVVQFIGDSRARQIFTVFKGIISKKDENDGVDVFQMFDKTEPKESMHRVKR